MTKEEAVANVVATNQLTSLKSVELSISELELLMVSAISEYLQAQEPVAYLARRKDWPNGELSPFPASTPLKWAETKIPLIKAE